MSSSISSEHYRQQPNVELSPLPWSPTSATQELSHPGSFPASESSPLIPGPVAPVMLPGKAFEVRQYDLDGEPFAHAKPVLVSRHSRLPPMHRLFARIEQNDREFVQRLPARRQAQEQLGFFLDQEDTATGHTPLMAALAKGHLDLAVDLMMLGANPVGPDLYGRTPRDVIEGKGMASMLMRFMAWHERYGAPSSTAPSSDKERQKLLNKIDVRTGHTLLTWAISKRHDTLVQLLIGSGADFRVANKFGKTALEEACTSGSATAVALLLDDWSDRRLEFRNELLIASIDCAVHANRPMVLAQLLSFSRDQFRYREVGDTEADDDRPTGSALSHTWTQRDAYGFFLGGQRTASATFDVMMDRTTDYFLLTEKESSLLRLDEVVALAGKKNLTKIVEIIHAHAKLPRGY